MSLEYARYTHCAVFVVSGDCDLAGCALFAESSKEARIQALTVHGCGWVLREPLDVVDFRFNL